MKIRFRIQRDKLITAGILAFLIAMCGYAAFFLYKNFYVSLAQVENIETLEKSVSRERLNKKLWDSVMKVRQEKLRRQDGRPATIARDPFETQ